MRGNTAKLIRRYTALFPQKFRGVAYKSAKRRWDEADQKTRESLREQMESALATPTRAKAQIRDALIRRTRIVPPPEQPADPTVSVTTPEVPTVRVEEPSVPTTTPGNENTAP